MDDGRLHLLTLRFASPAREAAFQEDYFRRSVRPVRLAILVGFGQYALFGLLDSVMVPDSAPVIRIVRVVVCAVLLGLLGLTFTRHFTARSMQRIVGLVPFVGGLGVPLMAYLGQDANNYYDYYAGLMLVLFYIHALLRLRFVVATALSWGLIAAYQLVTALLVPTPPEIHLNNAFFLGSANISGMVASYALEYYARRVYWQTQALDERNRLLEAEDRRKSAELDGSRRLQLAMLPQDLPDHPSAELAVFMQTATEVGGDYYDFDVSEDGALTFALGDATGHGAEAGIMVTATKVLFESLARTTEVNEFLRRANVPIRRVGRSRMFMALAAGRLRGRTLELAGAGMPPALIVRAATGATETIPLKGMPLGGFADFDYQTTTIELAPGDTVVLMSDGFPELTGAAGQQLGYEQALQLAAEAAGRSAEEAIAFLDAAMAEWSGGSAPNDDITFLVLRCKGVPLTTGNGLVHEVALAD